MAQRSVFLDSNSYNLSVLVCLVFFFVLFYGCGNEDVCDPLKTRKKVTLGTTFFCVDSYNNIPRLEICSTFKSPVLLGQKSQAQSFTCKEMVGVANAFL